MSRNTRQNAGKRFSRVRLTDRDWLTILAALRHDPWPPSRELARRLLNGTRHGRLVRMARLLTSRPRTIRQMQAGLGTSRRTIFRDLNNLEQCGVRLQCDDMNRYELSSIPRALTALLP